MFERICDVCNVSFSTNNFSQKRCSQECKTIARIDFLKNYNKNYSEEKVNKNLTISCDVCGNFFLKRNSQKRCSQECSRKANNKRRDKQKSSNRGKKWYHRNKEQILNKMKKNYQENPEKALKKQVRDYLKYDKGIANPPEPLVKLATEIRLTKQLVKELTK